MQWPLRRRRRFAHRTTDAVAVPTVESVQPTSPDRMATRRTRAAIEPRTDWARLDPLTPSGGTRPVLTFDGAAFGRSVAGAASLRSGDAATSGLRHRRDTTNPLDADSPPGVLRDIATVRAVVPSAPDHDTASRSAAALPDVVHRHAPHVATAGDDDASTEVGQWSAPSSLVRSDLVAPFDDVAASDEPDTAIPESISWTADDGFSTGTSSTGTGSTGTGSTGTGSTGVGTDPDSAGEPESRMRLVGQRRSFADATRPAAPVEPPPTDDEIDTQPNTGEPSVRYLPSDRPRTVVEAPPADIVAVVAAATGLDVGDTRIHRVHDDETAASRAVAFTKDGDVHIPASRGSLDASTNRPLVAHELTHVAQQRRLGTPPDELSAEGRRLESQARQVEAAVGGPVTPLYLPNRPAPAGSAAGIQRLADEWVDVDDSIDVHDDRRYDWQDRPQPPAHDADDHGTVDDIDAHGDRSDGLDDVVGEGSDGPRDWARRFELEHGAELQHRRDQRFDELVDDSADRRTDGSAEPVITPTDVDRARRRLDAEMPYEFGPGSDVDLYPDVRVPVTSNAAQAAPGATRPVVGADLRHRTTATPERSADAPAPSATSAAETAAASGATAAVEGAGNADLQRQLDEARAADQPEARDGQSMSIGDLEAFLATRFDRERDLRIDVLNDKLAANGDLEIGEILSLTEAEVDQIRGIVDAEMPLDVPFPQYLPLTGYGAIDRNGRFGAVDYRAQQRRDRATRRAAASTPATDPAANSTAGPTDDEAMPPLDELLGEMEPQQLDDPDGAASDDDSPTPLRRSSGTVGTGDDTTPATGDDHESDRPASVRGSGDDGDRQEEISDIVAGMSDLDVEMLSRRMYGRIRRTLRRELLIDRERAGSLADAC